MEADIQAFYSVYSLLCHSPLHHIDQTIQCCLTENHTCDPEDALDNKLTADCEDALDNELIGDAGL